MIIKTKDRTKTDYIVVSHSYTTPSADVTLESLDLLHRQRGFLSFQHHYLINRNGNIEQGRDKDTHGCASGYFNDCSVFIVLSGGLDLDGSSENNFTTEQMESLEVLVSLLKDSYPTVKVTGHKHLHNEVKLPI